MYTNTFCLRATDVSICLNPYSFRPAHELSRAIRTWNLHRKIGCTRWCTSIVRTRSKKKITQRVIENVLTLTTSQPPLILSHSPSRRTVCAFAQKLLFKSNYQHNTAYTAHICSVCSGCSVYIYTLMRLTIVRGANRSAYTLYDL